jgi:sterol desaturase/sphingolipid hydroxylase (fatty acid hydroxylase superfamily)
VTGSSVHVEEHLAMAQVTFGRYAYSVVFTIRVRQPSSVAGRCWNMAQDLVSTGAIVLIVLKLTGVINWSWWWVRSPMWISGALGVLVIIGVVILLRREASRHLCPPLLDHLVTEIQRSQARQ